MCVCVFFPSILDIKFVGRSSRGHTGGRSHRISHPPSFYMNILYLFVKTGPYNTVSTILCGTVPHPLQVVQKKGLRYCTKKRHKNTVEPIYSRTSSFSTLLIILYSSGPDRRNGCSPAPPDLLWLLTGTQRPPTIVVAKS